MRIIVDAMGGDNAPGATVKGAIDASRDLEIEILLVGKSEDILLEIDNLELKGLPEGVEIVNATEVIGMEDDPSNAVRIKKDSSLTVSLMLLRDGKGDAIVSAGNTGALLSGATLIVKRVRGIRRAALAPVIPNSSGSGFILIDCGANAECTPEYLMQFAYMGSYYAEDILEVGRPRVGLLNIGAERAKGTALQTKTFDLLNKAKQDGHINFIGNIEAPEALNGACDVLVADGYSGNILLKSIEGTAKLIISELKGIYKKTWITKLAALPVKRHLSELKSKVSADTIGGTMLLGISKPTIKAHGSSNAAAICSAIRQAKKAVDADVVSKLQTYAAQQKTG